MNKSVIRMCFAAITALAVAWPALADDPAEIRYESYPSSYPTGSGGNVSASACRDLKNDWPSPFTNAVCWSDGLVPHTGATYIAGQVDGKDSVLWTPINSVGTTYDMFDALVLTNCTLCIRHVSNAKAIFNDLRAEGSAYIYCADVNRTILGGKIHITDGAELGIASYNSRSFQVDSEISGGGTIAINTQIGTSSYRAYYQLYGANTNFLGKISVSTRATSSATFDTGYSTLAITNAAALGGTLPAFAYDALTLKYKSLLDVGARNIVLPSDANRGILISSGGGRINVSSGGTLTANWPLVLTKSVHFYKEGAGHIVLGKPLEFLNRNDAYVGITPGTATGNNNNIFYYVDVRQGTLAVADSHAVNGACVAFSNNTALVVSVDTANADLKKWGVRGDKTRYGTPFTTDVPIRLVAEGALPEMTYSVPLVTVKDTYAEDVAEKLKVSLGFRGYELTGVRAAAADGVSTATTFYADIRKKGIVIIFK